MSHVLPAGVLQSLRKSRDVCNGIFGLPGVISGHKMPKTSTNGRTVGTQTPVIKSKARPKIRPKNGFFCYVSFLGLIFWVTLCSNSNTLTFDSKIYIWNKSLVKKLL